MPRARYALTLVVAGFAVLVLAANLPAQGPPPMPPVQGQIQPGPIPPGQQVTPPPPPPIRPEDIWWQNFKPSAIEKVSPGVFRLGDITISKEGRAIAFPAVVNMDEGLLEYLLVYATGKTHESLLRSHIQPFNLQVAFLLLGFEGTDKPLQEQGDPRMPKGDPVTITVSYQKGGKTETIPVEAWVALKKGEDLKDAGRIDWVFTGSLVVEKQFLAQSSGSMIAIYRDPAALVDNASPGAESDEIWFVKKGMVPPVGTPVTVTIKAKGSK